MNKAPDTMSLPKGVSFRNDRKKKFVVNIPKQVGFATLEEAVAALVAYRTTNANKRKAPQVANQEKRAADMARNGSNSEVERVVAEAIVDACLEQGLRALVLNDSTRADVLLGVHVDEDKWLQVQLKTTAGPVKGTANVWNFSCVTGYQNMPVVCWRSDFEESWVYDGRTLDERNIKGLNITPGGKNEKLALEGNLKLDALVLCLQERANDWPAVTEDEARHNFASEAHAQEMRGMDMFRKQFPHHTYTFPQGQNTHVDLLQGETRLQFKTVTASVAGHAGFSTSLCTSGGRTGEGRRFYDPYPVGAFDCLVAVAWVKDIAHFWSIPAAVLKSRRFLKSESQDGKITLVLHAPGIGVQPKEGAKKKADTWTSQYYGAPVPAPSVAAAAAGAGLQSFPATPAAAAAVSAGAAAAAGDPDEEEEWEEEWEEEEEEEEEEEKEPEPKRMKM